MSAVTAVVVDVKVDEGHYDAATGTIVSERYKIYVTNGATQVAGGTDTLDLNVSTALSTALRSNRTYTLRDWSVCQKARGASADFAATGTVSGSTISLTPKTPADWSTNATITASELTATNRAAPMGVYVLVDVT